MNIVVDRLWGYWLLCLMARRPVLLAPPTVTHLVALLEGGHDEFEQYLASLGFELEIDEKDGTPSRSKKFSDIEAFERDATKFTLLPLPHIRKIRTKS